MSHISLVEIPRPVCKDDYERAIERMVNRLSRIEEIKSIYQIGGVTAPGISDIDINVVFHNGATCGMNPLNDMTNEDRYLFIHGLFGVHEENFSKTMEYQFFHDYKLLWGDDMLHCQRVQNTETLSKVNRQTGLEYLLKIFINMAIEKRYRIIKVRNILLHTKGLIYDLDYVGLKSGKLHDHVNVVMGWRSEWFLRSPGKKQILEWFDNCYSELKNALVEVISSNGLYVPEWVDLAVSGNIMLQSSSELHIYHSGVSLPSIFGCLGKKYFNIQHRFNRFLVDVPLVRSGDKILNEHHRFVADLIETNRKMLPHFMAGGQGLNIYRKKR